MKSWFATLNPTERRFVVFVGLMIFIVINLIWVRPHFADWGKLQKRLEAAHKKQQGYEETARKVERIAAHLAKREGTSSGVPAEDQAIEFLRTIQTQAVQAGVQFIGSSKSTTATNKFFIEQMQTIKVSAEEDQLVDFLFKLGDGNSLIRVRGMAVRPDQARNRLNADITLVASYQKTSAAKAARTAAPAATAKPGAASTPASPPGAKAAVTNKPASAPPAGKAEPARYAPSPAAAPAASKPPVAPAAPPAARPAPPAGPPAGVLANTNRPAMPTIPAIKPPTIRTSAPGAKPAFVPPPPPKNP